MAGISETIIDAIRRIAETSPDISSAIGALRKRGVIDGITSTLGGDNDTGDDESCCGDPGRTPGPDGPCDPAVAGEIWCNPDDDDPWTDCETGKPVDFNPQGFPQAETCKECAPDDTWEQSYYYYQAVGVNGPGNFPSQGAFCSGQPSSYFSETFQKTMVKDDCFPSSSGNVMTVRYVSTDGLIQGGFTGVKAACRDSTESYCTLEEPPEVCGDDWASDGSTSYTLRNGCIVASKCDTDASSGDLGCNKCKKLCRGGIEREVCATSDGGMTFTDPSGEESGGKYDGTGKRQEQINPGETGDYI